MPRARKIWKKAGRNYYYTKIDGVQTRLDKVEKGEAAGQRKLEKILRGAHSTASAGSTGMTFARLADKFLGHSEATNEPETFKVHKFFLQRLQGSRWHAARRQAS